MESSIIIAGDAVRRKRKYGPAWESETVDIVFHSEWQIEFRACIQSTFDVLPTYIQNFASLFEK